MDKNAPVRDDEILSPVRNDEILYRSIRGEEGNEYKTIKGKPDFNEAAFKARNRKPSVDRTKLRDHPSLSRLSETDGIVSLIVHKVRAIKSVRRRPEDKKAVYAVDVIYAPTMENPAHSEIIVIPEYFGSNKERKYAYKLLRIALALIATENGWTLKPLE